MSSRHDAPHDLVGAYVLDALDESERAAFERHLGACIECRDEVDHLHEATAALASTQADRPPAALRQRVLEQSRGMAQDRPDGAEPQADGAAALPDRDGDRSLSASDPLLKRRPALGRRGLALVAALLIGLAVVTFASLQGDPSPVEQIRLAAERGADAEVENLLDRFGDQLTVDEVVTDRATTARVVRGDDTAVLLTDGLPALAGSQTYQAWVIDVDGPTSAGVLGSAAEPSGALGALPDDVEAVAVSVEPAGGSEQPGDDIRAVVPIR